MNHTERIQAAKPIFHFIANGMFGGIGGGDIHFLEMAKSAIAAGYRVHFFGGYVLRQAASERLPEFDLTLTEKDPSLRMSDVTLGGQIRLFHLF
ncbi:MAG TPA: hypothetical protein VNU95_08860, partial [Candidatus Acidoferrales bacterium]|nr:hypothetical protein [Candidatus Acidoferrales bacterium]